MPVMHRVINACTERGSHEQSAICARALHLYSMKAIRRLLKSKALFSPIPRTDDSPQTLARSSSNCYLVIAKQKASCSCYCDMLRRAIDSMEKTEISADQRLVQNDIKLHKGNYSGASKSKST
eukprot:TRINITY_DN8254_c0_g1_i1.p1 TRINITY_DN8254_c0_g1~~TRINITY_DN8254_c0_g1_i1.p1  ORF type:complete len:123 (-),score=6.31 TRINITY_DN8254_c0_g1_i1:37-405(-)